MNIQLLIKAIGLLALTTLTCLTSTAQKKVKPKLSVEYCRIMGQEAFIQVKAKAKIEKKYEAASGIEVQLMKVVSEDSLALIESAFTNGEGLVVFPLLEPVETMDSVVTHEYKVSTIKNERFKAAEKSLSYQHAELGLWVDEEDSIKYVRARLLDGTGQVIRGEKLTISVLRLFAPLDIGNGKIETDKKGLASVAMENPLPSIDGVLTFEAKLDSKTYGQVTAYYSSAVGKLAVEQSTYDERTMWGPPSKTPWFLLIFANVIIFGMWIVIFFLLRNIYLIQKS